MANKVGRPPIHTDPKEVDRLIDDYFVWILGEYEEETVYETVYTKDGSEEKLDTGEIKKKCIRKPEPPTVTGLALHLGFCDKSTLYDYRDKPEFTHSIKRGLSMVEKYHEIQIAEGDKCTGNIFALKNMGWSDKQEIKSEHSGEISITRRVISK